LGSRLKPERYENGDEKEDDGYNRNNNTKQDIEPVSREKVEFFVAVLSFCSKLLKTAYSLNTSKIGKEYRGFCVRHFLVARM